MASDVDIDYKKMSQDEIIAEVERLNDVVDEKEETISTLEDKVEELDDDKEDLEETIMENEIPSSRRPPPHFRLPDERPGITHRFKVGGELGHGYLIVGLYPDSNEVGEIFIKMNKTSEEEVPNHLSDDPYVLKMNTDVNNLSAFLRGVLDQLAISVSIGLQRGIPLDTYASKFRGMRFPPDGMTSNPDIGHAMSIVDYIFRYLGYKFIQTEEWEPPKRVA